jgi:hypothetical protein
LERIEIFYSAADNEFPNDNRSPGGSNRTSQTSSNPSRVRPVSNQPSPGSCRKRNRLRKDDDNADEDESRRRQTKSLRPDDAALSSKLLACPFWKLDPGKHRECFRMKLDRISRVKQHLNRKHAPDFYCEFCLLVSLDTKGTSSPGAVLFNLANSLESRIINGNSCQGSRNPISRS